MTVKRLIELLRSCPQEGTVTYEDGDQVGSIESLAVTYFADEGKTPLVVMKGFGTWRKPEEDPEPKRPVRQEGRPPWLPQE